MTPKFVDVLIPLCIAFAFMTLVFVVLAYRVGLKAGRVCECCGLDIKCDYCPGAACKNRRPK